MSKATQKPTGHRDQCKSHNVNNNKSYAPYNSTQQNSENILDYCDVLCLIFPQVYPEEVPLIALTAGRYFVIVCSFVANIRNTLLTQRTKQGSETVRFVFLFYRNLELSRRVNMIVSVLVVNISEKILKNVFRNTACSSVNILDMLVCINSNIGYQQISCFHSAIYSLIAFYFSNTFFSIDFAKKNPMYKERSERKVIWKRKKLAIPKF